jgi:hypothetical protein
LIDFAQKCDVFLGRLKIFTYHNGLPLVENKYKIHTFSRGCSMKNKQDAWNKFAETGRINDYLEFCSLCSKEENRHAPKYRRSGNKGNGNRRK